MDVRMKCVRVWVYGHVHTHMCGHVYGHVLDMCMDMCLDICDRSHSLGPTYHSCTDICVRTDMCMDMYIDMCMDMYISMCVDIWVDILCLGPHTTHEPTSVCRHVCRPSYRHV